MQNETIHLKDRFPFLGEDNCDPTLELFLPQNLAAMGWADKKRPCMLICPGGGYQFVSTRESEPIAVHLLPEGFNVFILQYSTQDRPYPVQLREVAAAMELIYENAEAWHCDTDRIAIMGFSAGGHLAAHYTNRWNCADVREFFPESKPVNASVLGYPVITADPVHSHKGSFIRLAGGEYPQTEEQQAFFSCNKMVTENTPPTFLWHTAADQAVPVMNSLLYAQALSANKVPFEMHIFPYGKHGMSTADGHTNAEIPPEAAYVKDWLPAAKKWLKMTFSL